VSAAGPYRGGVAQPDAADRTRIGVALDREPRDLHAWLADGAAFDAAGADALWVELSPSTGFDPLTVTAALAAVTQRCTLVVDLPAAVAPDALATLTALSRGRLRTLAQGDAAAADGALRRSGAPPLSYEQAVDGGPAQRWVATGLPDGRAAWRTTLVDALGNGVYGVIVPADPRILDLLRNPDDDGDRRDLYLAVG
jgi:hypothetical protein